jgi:putative thiamine transport system permease protein
VWAVIMGVLVALSLLGTVSLATWSFSQSWFFPQALPAAWTISHWGRHAPDLVRPMVVTLTTGLISALIGLVLAVGCLQNERVNGFGSATRALWLLYTPLLVPQIAFLFGAQMLLVRMNLDGTWVALVWSHLLFVFPYVFLSLSDPWRAFDLRYRTSALTLTGSPMRVFLRVELPLMLRPMLFALAIGFAVSVGQYLPTIFAGGGRFTTLTVEAVTLSSGNDSRVTGIYALMQALLPLVVYLLAVAFPAVRFRKRMG